MIWAAVLHTKKLAQLHSVKRMQKRLDQINLKLEMSGQLYSYCDIVVENFILLGKYILYTEGKVMAT